MAYRTTRAKGFQPTLKNPQKRTILRSDAVQHRRYWRRRYWWTWPGEIPEKLAPLYWWRCPGCYCYPTDYISFQPGGDTLSDHIRTRCELDLTAGTIGLEGWEGAALRAIHYDEGSATWVIAGGAKEEEGIGVTGGVRAAYSKDNGHTWVDISDKFEKTNHKKQNGNSGEESSEENYDFVHALASDGAGNWVAVGGFSQLIFIRGKQPPVFYLHFFNSLIQSINRSVYSSTESVKNTNPVTSAHENGKRKIQL